MAWNSAEDDPEIEGDYSLVTDTPLPRRVLGFGSWLAPDIAQKMDHAVERLRDRGEAFSVAAASSRGRHFEIDGRAVAGRAVMRIRDVSGDRLQLVRLRESHTELVNQLEALRAMLNAIPHPVWTRDGAGRLAWANSAYARAVEAKDLVDAVARALELFDNDAREAARAARQEEGAWRQKFPQSLPASERCTEVVDIASSEGSAGMASDLSELTALRSELQQQVSSHARTLDQLSTAVAIFDRSKRLIFYNSAYRQLWSLDAPFLDQQPTDGEVLDRLRAKRQLPEQADFRGWKAQLQESYHAIDSAEYVWYLPDGRTLRAVASPNTQGGVTYLFDDVTQRFNLESQFNALTRVQGETLDTLKEGVAVFGADGRLKLINPAFASLWRFDPIRAVDKPHIDEMAKFCAPLFDDFLPLGRAARRHRRFARGPHHL